MTALHPALPRARAVPPGARAFSLALRTGAALLPAMLPVAAQAQDARTAAPSARTTRAAAGKVPVRATGAQDAQGAAAAAAESTATAQLLDEVRQMRAEMGRLRAELDQVKRERGAMAASTGAATVVATPAGTASVAGVPAAPPAITAESAPSADARPTPGMRPADRDTDRETAPPLSIFGYGEMNYSRPRQDPSQASATARRAVIGFGYRFDERTRLGMEIEIEDAVASASDKGEVAIEQLYIEHDLTPRLSAKAGLFLLPMGYLNEVHEPTRYYGVTRNFVETAIIPSTWREMGIGLRGTTDAGLRWDAGVVTGFDLGKWDATSTEGRESPLGAIHQEGSQARARSLATYAALNWNGWPGVNLGGSVYSGGAGHKQADFAGADASVTLMEAHARWSPGRWELTALSAAGRFRGIDALNATFAGQASPIPARFGGSYLQAAYRAWDGNGYRLVPFGRYERFNTASGGFPGLPVGLSPDPQMATKVWTAGASLYLNPQVVLKVDYQKFVEQSALDRLNLGVGFHF